MQFIHSMRINILTALLFGFTTWSNAQLTSSSPYSSYGFGERTGNEGATAIGLGMNTLTYFDSTIVNLFNPSSYSRLADGIPLFSIGVNANSSFFSNGTDQLNRSVAYLDHIAMVFTLKKRFGLAFGLKPYAKRGYEITEKFKIGDDSLRYTYIGNGSVNQVFIGLSGSIIKRKNTILSVGGNIGYLFGTVTNERRSILIDANSVDGGINWNAIRLNSLHYELGAHYEQQIGSNHQLKSSVVIEPSQQLNAEKDEYLFYGVAGNPQNYDTLSANANQSGKVNIPTHLQIGFNYNFWFQDAKKNNVFRNSEIGLHIGYSTQNWSNFSTSFATSGNLTSAARLTLGVQYTPERKFNENTSASKFLERVKYRVGYYQGKTPYITSTGEGVDERGLTVGFGIPILAQNSLSSIQFGCAFGERYSASASALKEQYIRMNIGLILAPSIFDRWFRKRKLD